jgi:hypothetical protein
MRKAVDTLWEISRLGAPFATGKSVTKLLQALAKQGFDGGSGSLVPCSRFITYARQKMTQVIRIAIDR